jgi:hypothetical protein
MPFDWGQHAESLMRRMGPPRPPACLPPMGRLYNGIVTLTLPDGSHKTFQIKTGYDGTKWCGLRTIGLLVGPSNTEDYDIIATVTPDGITPLKRVTGVDGAGKVMGYLDVLWRMAGGEVFDGYEVLESRHCIRCNRLLTTESSILRGIGEICEGKS